MDCVFHTVWHICPLGIHVHCILMDSRNCFSQYIHLLVAEQEFMCFAKADMLAGPVDFFVVAFLAFEGATPGN